MKIPPNSWGAVEKLIYENYLDLRLLGYEVDVVNVPNRDDIIRLVNQGDYDVVHVHYDEFFDVLSHLKAKVKIISSHYPYINLRNKWTQDGYGRVFNGILNEIAAGAYLFASSKEDIQTFINGGIPQEKTWLSKLSIRPEEYPLVETPKFPDRTLCLGKITQRKRQWSLQSIGEIDFVGPYGDGTFDVNRPNYKGAVDRTILNSLIGQYGNFILLSEGENATPLVVKEALVCGLPVVVSECCALELDRNAPFVNVISDRNLDDLEYIRSVIESNRQQQDRTSIRSYAIDQFGSNRLIALYVDKIRSLL